MVAGLVGCTTPNPIHRRDAAVDASGAPADAVVGPVCTSNQALRCDGSNLVRCNLDGTGEFNQPCSAGCNAGQKLCHAEYKDSSILWRRDDGLTSVWLIDHTVFPTAVTPGPQDIAWTIRGTGDFDGDGHGDILFQNASGRTQIWYMSKGVKLRDAAGADPGLGWAIVGVGNFDADVPADGRVAGRADALWRKGAQLAISFAGTSWDEVSAPVEPGWEVKGVGDFDGDAHSDILWRHSDGRVSIWFMSGTRALRAYYPGGQGPGASWGIQGVGDFDADSRDDILWRDDRGALAVWFGGDQPAEGPWWSNDRNNVVGWSWRVEAIGDLNHDKAADLLWRSSDGKLNSWTLAGVTVVADIALHPGLTPEWQIKGLLRD